MVDNLVINCETCVEIHGNVARNVEFLLVFGVWGSIFEVGKGSGEVLEGLWAHVGHQASQKSIFTWPEAPFWAHFGIHFGSIFGVLKTHCRHIFEVNFRMSF